MEDDIDLRTYAMVLLRQWKWIVGLAVLAALVAGAVSFLLPPTYEATALVTVAQPRYLLRLGEINQTVPIPFKAYPDLALSDSVVAETFRQTKDLLPPDVDTLSKFRSRLAAAPAADQTVLRLTVQDADPGRAAEIANLWAAAFTDHAGQFFGQDAANLANYEEQLVTAKADLDAADQALADFQARNTVPILEAQLESQQATLTDYLNRRHQLDLLAQDAQDMLARLERLDPAAPSGPSEDLGVLLLSVWAFGGQTTTTQQSQQTVPLQLQINPGQSLSGKTVAEQKALVNDLLATLQTRLEGTQAQAGALEPEILELQGRLGEAQAQEDRLTRARDLAVLQFETLANKVQEARIAAQESANLLQIASEATVPSTPAGPKSIQNIALAGVVALMLGILAAFGREWWLAPRTMMTPPPLAPVLEPYEMSSDGGHVRLAGQEGSGEATRKETTTAKAGMQH